MKKSKGISNQMDMLNGSIFDKILLKQKTCYKDKTSL